MSLTIRNNKPEYAEFNDKLAELKERLGISTATKVIETVVLDYATKCDELETAIKLLVQNEAVTRDLLKVVGRIKRIEKDMKLTLEGKDYPGSDENQLSLPFMREY